MPRLLLVTPAELTRDPRARRAAEAAKELGFGVVGLSGRVSGEQPAELADVVVVRAGREGRTNERWKTGGESRPENGLSRELRGLYRLARLNGRTATLVRAGRTLGGVDVVHANDLDTLPAAYLLAKESGARLVYDAHELYGEFDPDPPRLARAALKALERLLARRADAVVTVSDEIAAELASRLGVEPIVVLNAPRAEETEPPEPGGEMLRAVYQGAFGTGRPFADLVEILRNAPSVRLTLRVNRSTREQLARELPGDIDTRVEVADPVAPTEVVRALHGHHVGLLFDRPLTRNAELSSPNKLFEYLMAGLAVVAPRLPGLRWIEAERLGVLAPAGDPAALGAALERLAGDPALLAELRRNARLAALERYNAEAQRDALRTGLARVTLRVLHAPHAVAGHAPQLAAAERELGLDSVSVALGSGGPRRELERWRLLRRALSEFDVVHFNFGSTFLPRRWPSAHHGVRSLYGAYARAVELRDLQWLRRAGKAVFVTFQGDDVRTAEALRARVGDAPWLEDYYDARDDERKQSAARRLAEADGTFVLNPDLLPLVPGASFLQYASVDLRAYARAPLPQNDPPVVLHAPTDRRVKGTEHVLAARGDFAVRLVEHATRDDVRRSLEAADVYVDQLVLGWYGGTAVEAMALGRPVVAYLHGDDLARVPIEMRDAIPIVHATPATLTEAIEDALARREELAERGRAYVERWHDPLKVAARTKAAYEDAVARITRR